MKTATVALRGKTVRRFFKVLIMVIGVVAVTPLVLTVIYSVVNPISMPVLKRMVAGSPVQQHVVPLSEISPNLVRSVILAEDARFCLHYGVDLEQMRIVIEDALDGERPRGASTITMQTVKNLFLWPGRDYMRKAIELPLAFWFDLILSKDRIIEIYLNIAQWGSDIYGIDAASEAYFGKSAARLSANEALALATMLPAPAARNPNRPSQRQRRVMRHVARELERAPWVFDCLPPPIRVAP
ncbi:MAG: biosynthetic peptidoglycan transglycosylase [Pseudomonadota bacterium]